MNVLQGIRVIDVTQNIAGPHSTQTLGDLGADVIKIEPPGGDPTRSWGPPFWEGEPPLFLSYNRNKRSVVLDLKSDVGRDALWRLIDSADVFVQAYRAGVIEKLGFDYDSVREMNPRLVFCSITGYGQQGPKRALPGYDAVVQAESGLMHVTGHTDGPPTRVGVAITDYLAGLYAMNGILLALRNRDETGLGQHVDIALLDAMTTALALPANVLFATGQELGREGNDHHMLTPYETVEVSDGLVMVAVGNQRLWHQFCRAIGQPQLDTDPRFVTNTERMRHRAGLKSVLDGCLGGLTRDQLIGRLRAHAVPCGEVRTLAEALEDPQMAAREMVVELAHPELGPIRSLGNPIKLSRTPPVLDRPPPSLGQHTAEILGALGLATATGAGTGDDEEGGNTVGRGQPDTPPGQDSG